MALFATYSVSVRVRGTELRTRTERQRERHAVLSPKEPVTWQRDRPVMKQPLCCEGLLGESQEDIKISKVHRRLKTAGKTAGWMSGRREVCKERIDY